MVLAVSFVACGGGDGDSPTSPTMSTVVGTFSLTEVQVTSAAGTQTFTPPTVTGSLTLNADGTFSVWLRAPDFGIDDRDGGTYTVSGSTLTVRYADGSSESAVISDDSNRIVFTDTDDGETVTATFSR